MKTIRIGRSSSNECVIDNPTVSRNHAIINLEPDGNHAILKDLNSGNGTYINGSNKRITTEVRISKSDSIQFGTETMTLSAILEKANKTIMKPLPTPGLDRRTIGKSTDNQIIMNYDDVSRRHALLYKDHDGSIVIEDLNSTNGTYVNGVKVTSKKLKAGDKVTITRNHQLDWENVFGGPDVNSTVWKTILRVACVLIVISGMGYGVLKIIPNFTNWSKERIYKEYHSAVCWVYVQYGYKVYLNDEDFTTTLCQFADLPVKEVVHLEDNKLKSGGCASQGTAFFISNDGKLATNLHISRPWLFDKDTQTLENMVNQLIALLATQNPLLSRSKVEVKGVLQDMLVIPDGLPICAGNAIECDEIKGSNDVNKDVAILKVKTNKLPVDVTNIIDIQDADISESAIVEGKTIYTIGFPYGADIALDSHQDLKNQVHDGSITQNRGDYEFGHDAETAGGASGSPIINSKGKLIGVHHAGMTGVTGAQGFNMAIKAKYIVDLLNK